MPSSFLFFEFGLFDALPVIWRYPDSKERKVKYWPVLALTFKKDTSWLFDSFKMVRCRSAIVILWIVVLGIEPVRCGVAPERQGTIGFVTEEAIAKYDCEFMLCSLLAGHEVEICFSELIFFLWHTTHSAIDRYILPHVSVVFRPVLG